MIEASAAKGPGKSAAAIGRENQRSHRGKLKLHARKHEASSNAEKTMWFHFSHPSHRLRLCLSEGRSEVGTQRSHEAGGILQVRLARAEEALRVFIGHELSLERGHQQQERVRPVLG